jgi:hypothetical protein
VRAMRLLGAHPICSVNAIVVDGLMHIHPICGG